MKIVLIVLGTLIAIVLLVVVAGWSLPVKHRASRQATYPITSPESLYAAITSVEAFPTWRSKVTRVERVASPTGARGYRETGGDGAILYVVDEEVPSRRLVSRIADPSLPFGGAWTFDLLPNASSTIVRITEDGEVYNPVYRFMSAYVFGHHATIDTYLTDLGRKFNTTVSISDASR